MNGIPDIPALLALHALAVMLIGVPFIVGAALSDKLAERDARVLSPAASRTPATHWYAPFTHPVRAARAFRMHRHAH